MTEQDLKRVGLKTTSPRVKILKIFEESSSRHLSAEDVFHKLIEAGSVVSLATVYRVLTQFEGAGLLTRLHFEGDRSVYELNQGEHHDHLVCLRCGRVDEFVDDTIEQRQSKIAKDAGYEMVEHALNIFGVCSSCK